MGLTEWCNDLLGLVYPNVCEACGAPLVRTEKTMCLNCLLDLPRTGLHKSYFNEIHKRLASQVPIERAASYFYYYREDPYARIIQRAKYNSRPELARRLARMMAEETVRDGFFDGIDVIVPVPLHFLKRMKRGYNQSAEIAKGISQVTGIPVRSNALKAADHPTQTRRNGWERWLNTELIYSAKPGMLSGVKHALLVDDVITTGSTMLRCLNALHAAYPHTTLSVASLAITHAVTSP